MYQRAKRGMDMILSAAALLALLPLLLLLAIAIRLETPGSPLFAQTRVGKDGRLFVFIKLRSMVVHREGAYWTSPNDPRITRVGKFLRSTSLDELPQLWHVLKGDMSLVGPRPETPQQEALYRPEDWRRRHRVRPGITGLAQVNGRSSITPEDRLKYDLTYASHPTLLMDMGILWNTLVQAIRKTGVN